MLTGTASRCREVSQRNGHVASRLNGAFTTVLIASTNTFTRYGLRALLGTNPRYHVADEASTAEQTIQSIERHEPTITFIELCFKSSMGLQLIRAIAATGTASRILVASTYDTPQFAGRALGAGARGFVQKSAPPDEILHAFHELTAGRVYVTPTVAQQMLGSFAGLGAADNADPVALLTEREFEIFDHIGHGETTRRIARKLQLSVHTVETYRERIRRKLGIKNSTDLLFRATVWILLNS